MTKEITLDSIKDIIDYHNNLFGIKDDLIEEKYLSISSEIFNMINLFTLLDDDFNDEILSLLVKDVLSINICVDSLDDRIKQLKDDEQHDSFVKESLKIKAILNTKIYYLDLYLWEQVDKSILVQRYIRQKINFSVHNSFDFLTHKEVTFNTVTEIKHNLSDIDLKVKYDENTFNYICSLDVFVDRRKNELLRRLIDSKDSIPFFKNMEPFDIKSLVKDIEFLRYKRGEQIIKQGETSKEVYLVLSGSCCVKINNKKVATVEKNQLFGEFYSILNGSRTASVISENNVTVIRFNFAFELFDIKPDSITILYKNIINELIKKIAKSNKEK